ncbi:MAG: hypothetical protein ACYDD5_11130 [Sulfuricurvum sp.]
MKQDNLAQHRMDKVEKNRKLVERSIQYLLKMGGRITLTSVSETSKVIADPTKGEKGLTISGLQKNPEYDLMVKKAQMNSKPNHDITNLKSMNGLSEGDLRTQIFLHKQEIERLRYENKVLTHHLKNDNGQLEQISEYDIQKTLIKTKSALNDVLNTLAKANLTFTDKATKDIRIAGFKTLLLEGNVYESIFGKEHNGVKK